MELKIPSVNEKFNQGDRNESFKWSSQLDKTAHRPCEKNFNICGNNEVNYYHRDNELIIHDGYMSPGSLNRHTCIITEETETMPDSRKDGQENIQPSSAGGGTGKEKRSGEDWDYDDDNNDDTGDAEKGGGRRGEKDKEIIKMKKRRRRKILPIY
jgi:hypothetical protein